MRLSYRCLSRVEDVRLRARIAELEEKQRWIPGERRLPEEIKPCGYIALWLE